MSGDNTARRLYLLVNPNEPTDAATPTKDRKPSGLGLLGAFAVSSLMWGVLIWAGATALGVFSR